MKQPLRPLVRMSSLALAWVLGCCPPPPTVRAAGDYYGPTEPLAVVVNRINDNNLRVPTLWSRLGFQAVLSQGEKSRQFDGDGTLMYSDPGYLRMQLAHPAAGPVFELGVNEDRYWVHDRREDEIWWGRTRLAGLPCVQQVPIRPDLIAEVLGISLIDTDFAADPVPVMRFDNERDAYSIIWSTRLVEPGPARWVAQREVWYDRQKLHPIHIRLYDVDGRVLLRADLSNHSPLDDAGGAVVARRYDLFVPETGSRMTIDLRQVKLQNNGRPRWDSFVMPDLNTVGAKKVQQVDENCGP